MKHSAIALTALLALSTAPAAHTADSEFTFEQRIAAAEAVTSELFDELSGRLKSALSEGDHSAAIRVCRDEAPAIKTRLSLEHGWHISRVGTRVRNPLLGTPDPWERSVLDDFERRIGTGEPISDLTHAEVVEAGDKRYFRYMRGIGVQSNCLACHGAREQMDAPVRRILEERYPHDRAFGYEVGDLRGAFTVIQPMPEAERE